jgi:hypothetical protein
MVIVCVPLGMTHVPPSVPIVADAPGARGVLVNPQEHFTPSTKYATPIARAKTKIGLANLVYNIKRLLFLLRIAAA